MENFLFLLEPIYFPLIDPYQPRYTSNVLYTFCCMKGHAFQGLPLHDSPAAKDSALGDHEQGRNGGSWHLLGLCVCVWAPTVLFSSWYIPARHGSACWFPPSCKYLGLNEGNIFLHSAQHVLLHLTPVCPHNTGHLLTYYVNNCIAYFLPLP